MFLEGIECFYMWGVDFVFFGNFIVFFSIIIFLIYLDKSFFDGELEILCVNFVFGIMFQLQDVEFMFLLKYLNFWRIIYGLRELINGVISFFLFYLVNIFI